MKAPYVSNIPEAAEERLVERYSGGQPRRAEYLKNGEVIGDRTFHETGEIMFECGLRYGKRHGVEYSWYEPGRLTSAEPYTDGLPHGVARQYGRDGRLIGTYTLKRGTGIDLWRNERENGTSYLSEVLYLHDGYRNGFEWWINEDQRTVYIERHWRDGVLHGIEREWNCASRLRKGFPKYHVKGIQVTKRQYLKACKQDSTLPLFSLEDNCPERAFPEEIQPELSLL